jgi:hypothetical protein
LTWIKVIMSKQEKKKVLTNRELISKPVQTACQFIDDNELKGIKGLDKLKVVFLKDAVVDAQKKLREAQIKIMESFPHKKEGTMIQVDKEHIEAVDKELTEMLDQDSTVEPIEVKVPEELMEVMKGSVLSGFAKLMKVE